MKGSTGVPMQGIEKRPYRTGRKCKDCIFFIENKNIKSANGKKKYKPTGNKKVQKPHNPYMCSKTKKQLFYTSVVKCKKYVAKSQTVESEEKTIIELCCE